MHKLQLGIIKYKNVVAGVDSPNTSAVYGNLGELSRHLEENLSVKDRDILIGIDSPDTPAMGRDLGELADNLYENVWGWIKFEDILIGIDREYGIAVHSNLGKSPRDISKGERKEN